MNTRLYKLILLLAAVFTAMNVSPAQAQYVTSDQVLTAGVATTIPGNGAKQMVITYRPGSNISQTKNVKLTGPNYDWTPQKAGIFSISTPDGPSQTVSVSFSGFPWAGFIVFLLAGTILFGGATYAAINLFGDSSIDAV